MQITSHLLDKDITWVHDSAAVQAGKKTNIYDSQRKKKENPAGPKLTGFDPFTTGKERFDTRGLTDLNLSLGGINPNIYTRTNR